MQKFIPYLIAAAALSCASISQAGVIDFNTPAIIDIDNSSGIATYGEDGYAISGAAASFLTIDGIGADITAGLFLVGGETISLRAANGSLFSFTGLDAGPFGSDPGTVLSFTGVFDDITQLTRMITLAEFGNYTLPDFAGLTELRISASADVVLDNIMVNGGEVPEPASSALLLLGAGAIAAVRRRRKTNPTVK